MSSAISGSCPNNESVCFSPLLVAHVLIMNQYAFSPLLVAHVLIMNQYAFPRYWWLMS